MFIEDGKGQGNIAGVNTDNQFLVKSVTSQINSFISFEKGLNFIWTSSYSAGSSDYIFYLLNTNQSKSLRISNIILGNSVTCLFTLIKVTGGAPAGTVITGVNSNFASAITAVVTAYGNAAVTGSPTGSILYKPYCLANTSLIINSQGSLVLSSNTAIAVQVSAAGVISCSCEGWFE